MNCILLLGFVTLAAFADISRAELCLPDQFQGFYHWKALRLKPAPYYGEIKTELFSDAKNFKQAAFVNVTSGKTMERTFSVYLYNKTGKGMTAFILNLETKKCNKIVERNDTFNRGCLPADAKNLGSGVLGVKGQGSINVTDFGFEVRPDKTQTVLSATDLGSNMIPVHQTSFEKNTYEFTDVIFYNYTIGIQDPDIFDIPKPCQQGVVEHQADSPQAKELLQRFSKPF